MRGWLVTAVGRGGMENDRVAWQADRPNRKQIGVNSSDKNTGKTNHRDCRQVCGEAGSRWAARREHRRKTQTGKLEKCKTQEEWGTHLPCVPGAMTRFYKEKITNYFIRTLYLILKATNWKKDLVFFVLLLMEKFHKHKKNGMKPFCWTFVIPQLDMLKTGREWTIHIFAKYSIWTSCNI